MSNTFESLAPRERFHYCPQCAALAPPSAARSFACESCGFVLYFNVACALVAFIRDETGRLLMVRRAKDPGKGLLAFPGGFADPDETAEAGLRREVLEEVGLEVEITDYLGSHQNPYSYRGITYPVLDLFYVCRVQSPTAERLTLQTSEIAGYEWRVPEDLKPEEIAFPSQRRALQGYRQKIPAR